MRESRQVLFAMAQVTLTASPHCQREAVNTISKVSGLTRLGSKRESTAPVADAITIRPSGKITELIFKLQGAQK